MGTYEPCVLGSDGNCTRWSHDHAADRPSVTDNARAEQSEMLVDAAAIPTALLATGRAETTTATDEDAALAAEEALHAAGWFARADIDPATLRGILWDLSDAGLLATTRTRPTREELSTLILSFLKPPKHSGGSWTLNPDDAADAVLALLRDGAR